MTKTPDPVDVEPVMQPATRSRWSVTRVVSAVAGVGAVAIGVAAVLFPRDGGEKQR